MFYRKTDVLSSPGFEKNDFVQYTGSGVTFANTAIDEINKLSRSHKNGEDAVIWNQDFHLMQISEVINK